MTARDLAAGLIASAVVLTWLFLAMFVLARVTA